MKCTNPYFNHIANAFYGCGQCWQCRENKKRDWVIRMLLEAASHEYNCFVTLTHSDETLPHVCTCKNCSGFHPDGTLVPRILNNFHRNLRRKMHARGRSIRWFSVGEYGDLTFRAHYHSILFGVSEHQIDQDIIKSCWPHGNVEVHEFNEHTASYVAGYVACKAGKKDDPRLGTRHPVFTVMSKNPGIGGYAADSMSEGFTTKEGSWAVINGEAPATLQHSRKLWPTPRYIRDRIKNKMGLPDKGNNSDLAIRARARLEKEMGEDLLLPHEQKMQAIRNKAAHNERKKKKRQQIWASNKRGKHL